ncbi:hypothetical protein, partial [Caldisalinibacter kiritimatiensis]|uniref:hypothetical protein n=1 Tax=Caldisalinibacter kiritimatiensis TaxID=1304284 RepID=UPI0005590C3C
DKLNEDLEILINGEPVKKLKNSKEVSIEVYNNDLIEINGAKCREKTKVKVVGISKNIDTPKLNSTVTVCQSIDILGKVIIK